MKKVLSIFVTLMVLTTVLVAGQVNVMADDFKSGLVAHYDFNEIKDGVIKDVSGNGHDGTYQNVSAATGTVDGAVEFTGSVDGSGYENTEVPRVALPSAAFTSEDITIAILLNADFTDVDGSNCVVMTCGATWDTQFTFVNFWLNHNNNGGIGPHMAIQPSTGDRSHLRTEDDMVEEDEWVWLVYTQANGEGIFYLDGNEVASGDMDATIADIMEQGAGDMCIGTSSIFPGDDSFGGYVDEVLVYSRALTPSEAKNINNAVQAPTETEAPATTAPVETTPTATEEVPVTTEPVTTDEVTETPEATTAPTVKPAETVAPTEVPPVDDGGNEGGSVLPIIIVIVVVILAAGVGCYFFLKKKK